MAGATTALLIQGAASRQPAPTILAIVTPVVTPVNVPVPPPVVVAPPTPEEEAAPELAPPPVRALVPMIDAACVLPVPDSEVGKPTTCAWDDGFPAISADGSTIVAKYYPDDGGRGNPGLSIRFIDVETSRLVSVKPVLTPVEFDTGDDRAKLQTLVARRVARIQRTIDAGRYRSLVALGGGGPDGGTIDAHSKQIHAELIGTAVRIVDPATSSVLWRRDLSLEAPAHVEAAASRMDLCGGWNFDQLAVWWDPGRGIVLASLTYATGGCLCRGETHEQVHRIH